MKSIIQKSLVIALVYYVAAISSCIDKQCNCAPVTKGKFNYSELQSSNIKFTFKGDTAFTTNLIMADTMEKEMFGISLKMEHKIVAALKKEFSFINSAYACDCATSEFYIIDSVKSISIITLKNLDATHPAGSDVTEYFKALQLQYNSKPIKYYDAMLPGHFNSPKNPNVTGVNVIDLYLKSPVPSNQEVAFEITYTFVSGNKLSTQTKPIFLK